MNYRQRLVFVLINMTTLVLLIAGLGIYLLYRTALREQEMRLVQTAQMQAFLLESLYHATKAPEKIEQMISEIAQLPIATTNQVNIGKRQADQIILLTPSSDHSLKSPALPWRSNLAEPLRRALQGDAGTLIGLDHRGIKVLAAYEPVKYLNWGIVAQVDLARMQAPYLKTELYTLLLIGLVNGIGVFLLRRLSNSNLTRESRQVEEELRTLNQELEDRVAVRTAELSQINEQFRTEIVERRRLEEVLQREIDLLARIMETSPVGIIMLEPTGKIVIASVQAETMLGLVKTEKGYQAPSWSFLDEAGNPITTENFIFRQVIETGQSIYDVRQTLAFPDGRKRLLSVNGTPLFDETGQLEGVIFAIEDITERIQVETALLHSETQFRAIFEQASVGIGIVNLPGQFIRVNQRYCQLTGYTEAELQEKNYQDILHPDDLDSNTEVTDEELARAMDTFTVEKRYIRKDGLIIWVNLSGSVVKNPEGEPLYILGVVQDISEQKRAIEALQESEEQYRRIIETTTEGVWSINANYQTTFVNERMAQMLGYTIEAMLGRSMLDFTDEEGRAIALQNLERRRQGLSESRDFKFLRQDGTLIWTMIATNPIFDHQGNYTGALGMLTDITERKQTEEALQRANVQLTAWVKELEQRNQDILLLNQVSDFLQACLTIGEAYQVIGELLPALFTDYTGGLFIINNSSSLVEAVVTWGDDLNSKTLFTYDECWALRRGKIHWLNSDHSSLLCRHIHQNSTLQESLCVPMMAQGKAIGLLYLHVAQSGKLSEAKQQLAQTVAEHLSLALANLRLRETLQAQSIIDPLTNLYNRRYLEESLKREISLARRKRHPVGIIMLDVDHFRQFNEMYGHEGGNCALQAVGNFLLAQIRSGDIACRYGGEEFILILPEASLENSVQRAEEIRQGLKQMQVTYSEQLLSPITVSIGVASFPEHGKTIEALIKAADLALYQAKNEGRDRVKCYSVS